ncbi:hypothetical protein Celaphus_00002533, partial [Cervus elaphus hippelaphus]
ERGSRKKASSRCKGALQHNTGIGGAAVVTLYKMGFPEAASTSKTLMEPEVAIHQIRIPFTSHSVRSLEKLAADQRCKGKESQSERTCSDAYQDSENNYKENSLCPSEIVEQITSISIKPGV